jgi:hypothetical protein
MELDIPERRHGWPFVFFYMEGINWEEGDVYTRYMGLCTLSLNG